MVSHLPEPHLWTCVQTNLSRYSFCYEEHVFGSVQLLSHVQFLWPHGLQHTRLPCPSPIPRACSNSCPLSQWCHQPFHPLLSPSPPSFNLSQHQRLFQWVSSSHQVAKVLEFQNIQGWFPLWLTRLISLHSMGLSRVFSNTTTLKHQFFGAQFSLWSNSHIHTWLLEKP